jgi:hypothetical protein
MLLSNNMYVILEPKWKTYAKYRDLMKMKYLFTASVMDCKISLE